MSPETTQAITTWLPAIGGALAAFATFGILIVTIIKHVDNRIDGVNKTLDNHLSDVDKKMSTLIHEIHEFRLEMEKRLSRIETKLEVLQERNQ